jgi:hypothetical protein
MSSQHKKLEPRIWRPGRSVSPGLLAPLLEVRQKILLPWSAVMTETNNSQALWRLQRKEK